MIAGTGTREARPQLQPEVLALPPRIAVFHTPELNRDLYLWLAALAAHIVRKPLRRAAGQWLDANLAATQAALHTYPGLRGRHAALVRAHLAQRPALSTR